MKVSKEVLNIEVPMKNSEKVIALVNKFEKFINMLNAEGNVLIGGTSAIVLHGLKLSRFVDDLDIVIYSPTDAQKAQLKNLKWLDIEDKGNYPTNNLKIKKDDMIINVLTEEGELPGNLLNYKGIPIQSVAGVLEAKRSYNLRPKDMIDYIALAKNFL